MANKYYVKCAVCPRHLLLSQSQFIRRRTCSLQCKAIYLSKKPVRILKEKHDTIMKTNPTAGWILYGVLLFTFFLTGWHYSLQLPGFEFEIHNAKAKEYTWQERVMYILEQEDIDTNIAQAVIQCESTWNPKAEHKNRNGSNDKGLWQLNSIHKVPDNVRLDPILATYEAVKLIKSKTGWRHWAAYSNGCYKKHLK